MAGFEFIKSSITNCFSETFEYFLFLYKNICCCLSLVPRLYGDSNDGLQHIVKDHNTRFKKKV